MKIATKFTLVLIVILVLGLASCSQQEDLSELNPYLKKTVSWKCKILETEIPLNIYYLEDSTDIEGSEVIVYVKNRAIERIGQEPDLPILMDYIRKKFIVITADFGNNPEAVSPFFDFDLHDIFRTVYGYKTESLLKDLKLTPKEFRCFFLPEGYRVATDLVYWELDKHGVYGTLEYIMESYNTDIVPKVPGLKIVSSPSEMVDKKGNPFDFTVKMDIVYPSQPKRKLPVVFHSETLSTRNANEQTRDHTAHFLGFTMRAYVYVIMGHCFNPCVNHYFHFGKFELDHWNGFACYTAAMRYLNANADKYSMNTNYIGGIGYSKGQYAITRLSDPNHAGGTESKKYEGFPEGTPEPQPWPGYSSKINVGMQGMGMGLFETEYITRDYVPTIIICGENDRDVITAQHRIFVKRLEDLNVNHINLFMQGLGHGLPYGYDERMGVDRYQLIVDLYDRYLKVEEKLPPVVLVVSPFNNKEGVSPDEMISVHFAPVIDEKSVIGNKGIRLVNLKDKKDVEGKWTVSNGGTRFNFTPAQALKNNEEYKIIISPKIKDKAGIRMGKEKTVQFKVAAK
jgi:hypothetical protein